MSTRTVIEINHDYLRDLEESPEYLTQLLLMLAQGHVPEPGEILGVRFLGQRHHSDTLKLTIK